MLAARCLMLNSYLIDRYFSVHLTTNIGDFKLSTNVVHERNGLWWHIDVCTGCVLTKTQQLTRTEWYDLTETCFQSPSCMRTRNKLNFLRKLNFFALNELCELRSYEVTNVSYCIFYKTHTSMEKKTFKPSMYIWCR